MKPFSQENLSHHEFLLRISAERVEVAYLKSMQQKHCNPVVLILDLDDRVARDITRTTKRHEEMDRLISHGQQQNGSPIVIWQMPAEHAVDLLSRSNIDISDTLSRWEVDGFQNRFPVIVVGAGMVSTAAMPIPATESL